MRANRSVFTFLTTALTASALVACGEGRATPADAGLAASQHSASQHSASQHSVSQHTGPMPIVAAATTAALDPDSYITIESGTLPVVISAPHGGSTALPGIAVRTSGTTVMDYNTYRIALGIQSRLMAATGKKAYLVAALASRKYVDFNRSADLAYEDIAVKPVYDRYYGALQSAVNSVRQQAPAAALLVDVHGQSQNARVTYRGTRDGRTANNTVFYTTPYGLISSMISNSLNVNPTTAGQLDNQNFNGGNIVYTFGKNNLAGINSVQFELGYNFRATDNDADITAEKMTQAIVSHLRATGGL